MSQLSGRALLPIRFRLHGHSACCPASVPITNSASAPALPAALGPPLLQSTTAFSTPHQLPPAMFRTPVARLARSYARCGVKNYPTIATPPAGRLRLSTDITGLAVESDPLQKLADVYSETLRLLTKLPTTSVYRQATAALTEHRAQVVASALNAPLKKTDHQTPLEATEDVIKTFERQLGAGLAEEVLKQARKELGLAAKMLEWQAYVPAPSLMCPSAEQSADIYSLSGTSPSTLCPRLGSGSTLTSSTRWERLVMSSIPSPFLDLYTKWMSTCLLDSVASQLLRSQRYRRPSYRPAGIGLWPCARLQIAARSSQLQAGGVRSICNQIQLSGRLARMPMLDNGLNFTPRCVGPFCIHCTITPLMGEPRRFVFTREPSGMS